MALRIRAIRANQDGGTRSDPAEQIIGFVDYIRTMNKADENVSAVHFRRKTIL
jgi:hypothetical protein